MGAGALKQAKCLVLYVFGGLGSNLAGWSAMRDARTRSSAGLHGLGPWRVFNVNWMAFVLFLEHNKWQERSAFEIGETAPTWDENGPGPRYPASERGPNARFNVTLIMNLFGLSHDSHDLSDIIWIG